MMKNDLKTVLSKKDNKDSKGFDGYNFADLSIHRSDISDEVYEFVRDMIHRESGIYLSENKKSMIQSRLGRRLTATNMKTYEEYIQYVKTHAAEKTNFINALTTNKTDFFREVEHFNYIKEALFTKLVNDCPGGKLIYIWSAACSAGHEVYTLAMILEEFVTQHPQFDYKILGSDIDTDILSIAEKGIYPEDQINTIPMQYLKGNFAKGKGANSGFYKVSDRLRMKVKFCQHNLIDINQKMAMKFDMIFLRNVLIYFQKDVIQTVVNKLSKYLVDGGHFFIGHSETLNGIEHDLKTIGAAIFVKVK